jgi:pSer/pThr/pTyr-binding forkhead associated (FHA) protein
MREALAAETQDGAGLLSDDDETTATTMVPPPVKPPAGGAASVVRLPARKGSEQTLVVGRGEECDLLLAERSISRRHAELAARDDGFVVRDLGSSNGTQVNGRAAPQGGYLLSPGDIVAFGDVELLFLDAEAFWERVESLMD